MQIKKGGGNINGQINQLLEVGDHISTVGTGLQYVCIMMGYFLLFHNKAINLSASAWCSDYDAKQQPHQDSLDINEMGEKEFIKGRSTITRNHTAVHVCCKAWQKY